MPSLICPNCKCQANADELFCSKCGTKLEPAESISFYCKGCGKKMDSENRFCGNCGRAINESFSRHRHSHDSLWGCAFWLLIIIFFVIGCIWGYHSASADAASGTFDIRA